MASDELLVGYEGAFGEVKVTLAFKCSECSAEATFRATDEDEDGNLRCPGCGRTIHLELGGLRRVQGELDHVNATAQQFQQSLKRL